MARLIFRAFQCEMELDYIIASRLLLASSKRFVRVLRTGIS